MTTATILTLAHAGEGATWQALLTLLSLGLAAVFLLALFGIIRLDEPGDLILPLAGTAVLSSLSGATSQTLSDWVGWSFPIGVVALVALVLIAMTQLQATLTSPLTGVAVVVAIIGAITLQGPISRAWHPVVGITPDSAPLEDLTIEFVSPTDGDVVSAGTVVVTLRATGGSLGTTFLPPAAVAPSDPEEQVGLTLTVFSPETGDQQTMAGVTLEDCSRGCTEASYEIEVPAGTWTIFAEAKTADARPFIRGSIPLPTASATVTAQ